MPTDAIQYYDRYSGKVETEQVYGDGFLRWTYGNPLGLLALHVLVKRALFSRWYGWRMDRAASKARILPFIKTFKLNSGEFTEPPDSFSTFNEFFYRKLKPTARPIIGDQHVAVFPADGRHLGFQNISEMDGIFVKGQVFSLEALLRDSTLARKYQQGSMILSRLCPVDYHRFHFPVTGVPSTPQMINGPLFSVNPIALRQNIRIFTENKRAITRIESKEFGTVLMLEIGATCVGGFEFTFTADHPASKGAEKGYFKFGGSSTMLLFEPDRIQLDSDLLENSANRQELYARIGDRMGAAG